MAAWEAADTFPAVSPAALMARPDTRPRGAALRTPIMAPVRMVGPAMADAGLAGAATGGTVTAGTEAVILIGLGDGAMAGAVTRTGAGV